MHWKYGMIKVAEDLWSENRKDTCELVELHENKNGAYISFSKPFITCFEDLELAYKDVCQDGLNTWFFDNGKFKWDNTYMFWDWKRNKEINNE